MEGSPKLLSPGDAAQRLEVDVKVSRRWKHCGTLYGYPNGMQYNGGYAGICARSRIRGGRTRRKVSKTTNFYDVESRLVNAGNGSSQGSKG